MSLRAAFAVGLVTLGLATAALAETPQAQDQDAARALREGHVEHPQDAYAPVDRESQPRTPRAIVPFGSHVSTQVNVDASGQNIVGDAANEPSMAVDPTNPSRIVIGWRQFDTITNNFRQAGYGYSHDGGVTWTTGKIEAGVFRSDPVLSADAQGNFFYNSLTANSSQTEFSCQVYKSTDGGASWGPAVQAYGGDKQWYIIDATNSVGSGNQYSFWTSFYSACVGSFTRSIDDGQSFQPCTSPPNSPQWGTLAIASDGTLYIGGTGIDFLRSTTARFDGQAVTWDLVKTPSIGGTTASSTGPNPGGLLGQVNIGVDNSGGPTNGYLYILQSVNPTGTDPLDVNFIRSTDGGNTWSTPLRINADPTTTNAYQWFGTMGVAPNGRIDVVWLDTRFSSGSPYLSALFYRYSEDGGTTWADEEQISPTFNPSLGYPQQNKMGDYYHVISDNGGAHVAWAATFNGEEDVYYTYISRGVAITGDVPTLVPPGQTIPLAFQIRPGNDTLVGTPTLHYSYDGGPFTSVPLTPGTAPDYSATLPAPQCSDTPAFYISAEGDQSGTVYYPTGGPLAPLTLAVGEIGPFADETLDTNPGWTMQGQWQFGQPTGQGGTSHGNPDPPSGYTGANVFGVNLSGDYTVAVGGPYYLTAGPFDLSGATHTKLSFRRWLNSDYTPYAGATVEASYDGNTWFVIWQNGNTTVSDASWMLQEIDLTAVGDNAPTFYVRWGYAILQASAWAYSGWNIDDVKITGQFCESPSACLGDLNCDGVVNFRDIDPFVAALGYPGGAGWPYPCPWTNADVNQDGNVTFKDINAFVTALGTVCR